jgi:protein phosphatase
MGACLPKPVLATNIERHGSENFRVAIAEINGWRNSMEDAHVIVMRKDWGYFGVLDGHGGAQCSAWCAKHLTDKLESNGCPQDDAAAKQLILDTDRDFLATDQSSGSTAAMCAVHVKGDGKFHLHVINAGDSRVLLGNRNGTITPGPGTDQGLTTDHKPDNEVERERIERCGGTVQLTNGGVFRVNGDLAVSRGFGDRDHKTTGGPRQEDRPVTCDPEMGHFEAGPDDFMLIVCDGVSEGDFPNGEVIQCAADELKATGDPGAACKLVIHRAVERNSKDNITAMMVLFERAASFEVEHEFIPGPLGNVSSTPFLDAYSAMATRGGKTLAQAAAMRYDQLTALGNSLTEDDKAELQGFGEPRGAKGSSERSAYFAKWADDKQSQKDEGGENDQMAMIMEMMRAQQAQQAMQAQPEDGRRVLVTGQDDLKRMVDDHPALTWDPRMEPLAGTTGIVKKDDPDDGTTQVRFPDDAMVAWLPTAALTDIY